MSNQKIRSIRDGNWYWIDRVILNIFGRELKSGGIAVHNVLASFSNSKTQSCFPSQETIAKLINVSRKTVIKNIRLLKKLNLISIEKKKGSSHYLLFKPCVTSKIKGCVKKDVSKEKDGYSINKYIKKNNNNIVSRKIFNSNSEKLKCFRPRSKEELLAFDISKALNDSKNFTLYLSYAKKYKEPLLRKILGDVKETPPAKIKSSRSALFNYLLKRYAKEASKNLGN